MCCMSCTFDAVVVGFVLLTALWTLSEHLTKHFIAINIIKLAKFK